MIPSHAQHQHTAPHAPAQPGNGLIDAIPLIVWAAAPHGRLLYVNRHWTIFTGQEEGEALRDGTEAHVHPDDRACVALAWKQGLPGGEAEGAPFHFEFRLRGRHGEYRWHLARCVPERDAAGAVARWVGTAMDVHEREAADPATRDAERSLLLARADAALAEADMERRRLATLIEHLPVGVSLAEAPSGQLLVSNAAVDRIWGGAPQSEEIAEYSADYAGYHPESGRRYESHEWPLARALVNGEIVVDELVEVVRPDGSRRMVSISAAPVRGADGQIVAGAVTSMDVTEREELLVAATTFRAELEDGNATLREQALELELSNQQLQEQATELELQAEELQATAAHLEEAMESAERARRAAQAAEARLHSVFAQTPAAVAVTIGPEHRYTLVNARGAALAGRADFVGLTFREAFPEFEHQGFAALLDRVYATGEPVVQLRHPVQLARGDGTVDLWVDATYQPLVDGEGAVFGVMQHVVDVTDQVEAARAAVSSDLRYRALFDSMDQGFCLIEVLLGPAGTPVDYRFLEANPAFEGQTGLVGPAGRTARELVPGLEQHWIDVYGRVALTGEPVRFQQGSDAMERWFDVFSFGVGPMGDLRVAILFTDVTAAKLAERDRERLLAAERAARAEAEAANGAKAQFLATMSHELRTPLNAIAGYVQLIELGIHGPVTEAQRVALDRIRRAQIRLLSIINDILNYAKVESGHVEYDLRAFDARDVVAEVVPLVEVQMRDRGLALDLVMPRDPAMALADREKLGQVLVNLLTNATKFTNPRNAVTGTAGSIRLEVEPVLDGAAFLELRVTDNGRGIPVDKQATIFDPFVQVRSGFADTGEGTGLGLAISRDLARGMGGELSVESVPGEGSTFTLRLPAARGG